MQIPIDEADSADKTNPMIAEHPRVSSLIDRPMLTTLYYLSMYHWDASHTAKSSPMALKKTYDLSDKQFLWTVLRGRARVKHWPLPSDFDNLLSNKVFILIIIIFQKIN